MDNEGKRPVDAVVDDLWDEYKTFNLSDTYSAIPQVLAAEITWTAWSRLDDHVKIWVAYNVASIDDDLTDEWVKDAARRARVEYQRGREEKAAREAAKKAAAERAEREGREKAERQKRELEEARQAWEAKLAAEQAERDKICRDLEPDLADPRYAVVATGVRWYGGCSRAEAEWLNEALVPHGSLRSYALRVPLNRLPDELTTDLVGDDLTVPLNQFRLGFTGRDATWFLIDRAENRVVGVAMLDDDERALRPLLNWATGCRDPYTPIINHRLREAADLRRREAREANLRRYGLDLSEREFAELWASAEPVDDGEVAGRSGTAYLAARAAYMEARRASGMDTKPPRTRKPKKKPKADPRQVMTDRILAFVGEHAEGVTRTQVYKGGVTGANDRKAEIIQKLIDERVLREDGKKIFIADAPSS